MMKERCVRILIKKTFQPLKSIVQLITLLAIIGLGVLSVSAAREAMGEFWTVFLIEEEDASGAVAIYGNKVARNGGLQYGPYGHLVIIDLLDGSIRRYGLDEYPGAIDWIDMDGDWVVTRNNYAPQSTVNAINLVTDEHVIVSPDPGYYVDNLYPAIEGNNIVWMYYKPCCGWDLLHFDLDSRTTISITNDGWQNQEHWPDVSGDWVVWNNGSSQNGDIHAYNMATTEHVTVTQDSFAQWYPKIDGNLLTWTDSRRGPQYRDIYGFDMDTRQEFPLVVGSQPAYAQDIDGNILTWYESINGPASRIYGRNLDTGETSLIYETIPPSMPYGPTFLSENTVLWVFAEEGNYTEPRLYGARRLTYQSYLPLAAK